MVFIQREKRFKGFVSLQFLHTKKYICCKFVSKRIAWVFFKDIKMWPSHNVLNWYISNWLLFNMYVDIMAYVPMLTL